MHSVLALKKSLLNSFTYLVIISFLINFAFYNQQFQKAESPFPNCRKKYKPKDIKKQPLSRGCFHIRSLADQGDKYLLHWCLAQMC